MTAKLSLAAVVWVTAALPALAQVPPAAGAMPAPNPASLPGDRVMPHGPMGPPPGGMKGGKPPPEQGTDAPGPTLAVSIKAAEAAIAACAADGYKIGVSVLDSSGQPRASLSADGATGGHVYIAARKGLAALAFGMPSSEVFKRLQADPSFESQIKPNMAPVPGAVPLMQGGQVIGAIGASGASSMQDEKCAKAGAAKVAGLLR